MTELHRRSQEQEKRLAARTGSLLQPRSGAGWMRKNDVRGERFLYEAKRTDNKSGITIKNEDLRGLRQNAVSCGRIGVLQFELAGRDYYIVASEDWPELSGET